VIAAEPARELFGYRLATIGAFLGMIDTSEAVARRLNFAPSLERLPPPGLAERAWVDGLLAVARHDRVALARSRAELRAINIPTASLLDSSLMAFELDLEGNRRKAIEVLSALEVDRYQPTDRRHPYLAGIDRLVLSRWLRDAGRREEAAKVLMWSEAVIAIDGQTAHANAMLAGLAYFERARLEDDLGQPEIARGYYEQFLRRFDMPSPREQYLVEQARAAIAGRRSR